MHLPLLPDIEAFSSPAIEDDAAGEPAPAGALTSSAGGLPLIAVTVEADVIGLASSMRIVQRFRNGFAQAIEATYVFPLPDRAAVTRFTVTIGERRIQGRLMERGEARHVYDTAIAEGRRAATAEQERPDVFTTRVGNLQPGEEAEVELELVGPLPCEDGEAVVRVPLVVAPRYIPGTPLEGPSVGEGTHPDTDAVPDASRITPPVLLPGSPNPVQLAVSVRIDPAGLWVSDLRSSLHALADGIPAGVGVVSAPVTVRLQPGERLDRDFILRFRVASDDLRTTAVFTPDAEGDEGTLCVTLLAPPASGRPRDVVVVLDRSGSMEGWKMVAARRAAARIVDSLGAQDRFSVLAFDHAVERPTGLGFGLVPATDRNRFRAVEFLARLQSRGGTEMHGALTEALRSFDGAAVGSTLEERDPTCVLVTDGQVGNEDQLVRAVSGTGGRIRFFTVGIDRAVNAGLLQRLAAAGGGRCDLVESEDRLDEVLIALHRRISPPSLRDVQVTAADDVQLVDGAASPPGRPDCFPGLPLVLWRRYRGAVGGRVVIGAVDAAGQPVTYEVEGSILHSRAAAPGWARAIVRDLEDRYAVEGSGRRREETAARIVEISLRHGVLSRFTAFVAVDTSETTASTDPHRVIQPVELPSGWDPGVLAAPVAAPMTAELQAMPLSMTAAGGAAPAAPMRARAAAQMPPQSVARHLEKSLGDQAKMPALDLEPYRARARDLLDRVERQVPLPGGGAEVARLLADLHQLLEDLASVGAARDRLGDALRDLEASLQARPPATAEVTAAVAAVRAALEAEQQGRRRGFWR